MKKMIAFLLALCLLLGMVGMAGADGTAQVLKVGTDADPSDGLDPQVVPAHTSIRIMQQMYNQLVGLDENLKVIPELAESWEQPDETTYVFHLRQNVKFHNGRAMTADDVKYSFERILTESTGALGNSASYYNMIDTITADDPYTVTFRLKAVNAPFLPNLANICGSIVAKEVAEGENGLTQNDGGTGPFTLVEWVPDNHVSLKKFADYFESGEPKLDGIEFYVMPDMSARIAALRTGNIQLMLADSASVSLVKDNADIQVISYSTTSTLALLLNLTMPLFQDQRVREAISLAVDRQNMLDLVYNGAAVVSGFVPASLGHWSVDVSQRADYQQDIAKAKELLAEAGYPNGFEITITAGLLDSIRDCAVVLQQQLAEVGITATIENAENATYIDEWKNKSYQMMVGVNNVGTDPSRAVAFYFTTGAAANASGYSNAKVDELCAKAAATTDQAEREKYYDEAIGIILDDVAGITFGNPMDFLFARKELKGFTPTAVEPSDFTKAYLE